MVQRYCLVMGSDHFLHHELSINTAKILKILKRRVRDIIDPQRDLGHVDC